ncbi:MAG: zinc finger domain-containing protein [Candidatus Micrarchaeota archaeon]
MLKNCFTCGKQTREYAEFPCVNCGKSVVRCKHCAKISNPYKCPSCGQDGP